MSLPDEDFECQMVEKKKLIISKSGLVYPVNTTTNHIICNKIDNFPSGRVRLLELQVKSYIGDDNWNKVILQRVNFSITNNGGNLVCNNYSTALILNQASAVDPLYTTPTLSVVITNGVEINLRITVPNYASGIGLNTEVEISMV